MLSWRAGEVCRNVLRPRVLATSILTVVLLGVLPAFAAYSNRGSRLLLYPAELFTYLHRMSPLVLLMPLVSCAPYVVHLSGEVSHRFLSYARTRSGARSLLATRMGANVIITFITFFLIGVIPQFFVVWGSTSYKPESGGLFGLSAVRTAELGHATFSQFLVYGPWGFAIAYAIWLAVNAVMYSTLAFCVTVVLPSRVLGLGLVWLVTMLAIFLFAVLGLEAFSPGLYSPFNVTQLPVVNLTAPATIVGGLTLIVVILVLIRAPRLRRLQ